MVIENCSNTYTEVLEVLNCLNKEDFNKIPKEYIMYLKEHANKQYIFKYDKTKKLEEQNLTRDAKLILFFFFEEFGATKEQKEKIDRFKQNILKKEELEKQEKYNYNNLFKKGNIQNKQLNNHEINNKIYSKKNCLIVANKINIFHKILNYIKKFLKRKP